MTIFYRKKPATTITEQHIISYYQWALQLYQTSTYPHNSITVSSHYHITCVPFLDLHSTQRQHNTAHTHTTPSCYLCLIPWPAQHITIPPANLSKQCTTIAEYNNTVLFEAKQVHCNPKEFNKNANILYLECRWSQNGIVLDLSEVLKEYQVR